MLPARLFGDPFIPPVSDGSGQDRGLLRKASALLQQAGFVIKDGKRVTPKGEPISVEFLLDSPSLQRHHLPFIKNLGTLGIEASLRLVDPVQYRKRVDDYLVDAGEQRHRHLCDTQRLYRFEVYHFEPLLAPRDRVRFGCCTLIGWITALR